MSKKLNAAMIGPGRLFRGKGGTDLLMKMQRCEWIEPTAACNRQFIL